MNEECVSPTRIDCRCKPNFIRNKVTGTCVARNLPKANTAATTTTKTITTTITTPPGTLSSTLSEFSTSREITTEVTQTVQFQYK